MPLTTLQSMSSYTDKSLNIDNRIVDGTASSLKKAIPILSPTNHIITIDPNVGSMFNVYDGGETAFEIRFAELNDKYTMTGSDISVSLHLTDPSNTVITWPNNIVWENRTPPNLKHNNMFEFSTYFDTSSSTWNCIYSKCVHVSPYDPNDFTVRMGSVPNNTTFRFILGRNDADGITELKLSGSKYHNMALPVRFSIDNQNFLLTFVREPNSYFLYHDGNSVHSFDTNVFKIVLFSSLDPTQYQAMLTYAGTRQELVNAIYTECPAYIAEEVNEDIYSTFLNVFNINNFSAYNNNNPAVINAILYADPNRIELV